MSARINHPYLSSNYVEARAYQLKALNSILNSSTLLVLPTAMGKTPIEFMVIADKLLQNPEKKALLIAPTNPLLAQHFSDAEKFLNIPSEEIVMINGGIHWKKREEIVKNAKLVLSTPQVIRNDVKRGSLSLSNYCLLVIDEAHHASGKHAMGEVADQYLEHASSGLLLGATASPGSTEKSIINLTKRLDSKNIFSMQRSNPLIKPYAIELESNVINLDLPIKIQEMVEPLKKWLDGMVETLQRTGVYLHKGIITRTGLNDAMKRANYLIERKSQHGWNSIKIIVDAIRVLQLINLISTQGIISTRNYMRRTESQFQKGEKKLSRFVQKKEFIDLKNEIYNMKEIHNKMDKVKQLVKEQIEIDPNSRIIVFASLRDSVKSISISLNGINGINAIPFVGQSSRDGDEGMTQKQQISTLNKFREGELNVLVATSVGEEGLDIPSADRVVFYEPVASEIRTIQRRGRTGRHKDGYVYILISKNTRDEGIRHAAVAKEIRMHRILNRVKNQRNLSFNYKNPINKLNNFTVSIHENEYDVQSFIELEEERLKEISKKDTISDSGKNNQKLKNEMRDISNNLSISQKLRPLGQTGLEQFNLKSEEE
ncbi:MAG: ATP-dependent RNA helicase DbpA [Methanobacteriota archaeon]|nr:MAG: ATP-dependent RNA helicase DbpA [Euryarchaeota archaeon]